MIEHGFCILNESMLVNQHQVDCNHTCIYSPTKNIQELRVINNYIWLSYHRFSRCWNHLQLLQSIFHHKAAQDGLDLLSIVSSVSRHEFIGWGIREPPWIAHLLLREKKENINLQTWWSNLVVFTPPIITHLQMICLHIACAQYAIHSICRLHI